MGFLKNENLILPFLATLGASLAVIGFQAINRYVKERKQRIYTVNYMLDVTYRILSSEIIVKKHTIIPHIEATKRIMKGDVDLLKKTLLTDEFDILKAKAMSFSHLPPEYKLLVGYDNIEIVQMFDTFLYLYEQDENRKHLNTFVKENLKSMSGFLAKDDGERNDILNTYWDLLNSIDHETNRTLVFIRDIILPKLTGYVKGIQFLFFRTSKAKKIIEAIDSAIEKNCEILPDREYMEKVRYGGIQGEL